MNASHDTETMLAAYLECAVWAGSDWSDFDGDNPVPLEDAGYSVDDISYAAVEEIRQEVVEFAMSNAADLADISAEQAGHDFFLTRNRHGAGFWDRGLGEVGERLTKAAHAYGERDLYVGDDGQLHV